ncbi:cupredoxin domain-containing protein [candidate division WWE3 bacterium]|nr:cupredoxin domain-containing protein [candidate division WWE3 bacterium]
MITLIVNIIGAALIVLVLWFFLMKHEDKGVVADGAVEILVEGGYKPSAITVKRGNEIALKFHRKDKSSCLEEIVIPDFGVRQYLELGKTTEVKITPTKTGFFGFSCGMGMFHGKIKVID